MKPWLQTAQQPAVVVGTILILINHGDALLRGDIDLNRILKMLLTVTVPYMVSTYSAVDAIRAAQTKEHSDKAD
ncbi:MAG: hypothetical protein ACI9OD_003724 [Limisphaerales bacterium]